MAKIHETMSDAARHTVLQYARSDIKPGAIPYAGEIGGGVEIILQLITGTNPSDLPFKERYELPYYLAPNGEIRRLADTFIESGRLRRIKPAEIKAYPDLNYFWWNNNGVWTPPDLSAGLRHQLETELNPAVRTQLILALYELLGELIEVVRPSLTPEDRTRLDSRLLATQKNFLFITCALKAISDNKHDKSATWKELNKATENEVAEERG